MKYIIVHEQPATKTLRFHCHHYSNSFSMCSLVTLLIAGTLLSWGVDVAFAQKDVEFYTTEVDFLAQLGSRLTGSINHNKLIDHIQWELECMGLEVQTDLLNFTYNDSPKLPPQLIVGGNNVQISSAFPYSGDTDAAGVSGKLVDLSQTASPNWTAAAGNIAIVNASNTLPPPAVAPLWPDSPAWPHLTSIPAVTTSIANFSLGAAAAAGVKGVIWKWENISIGNAEGQYVPFTLPFQGIPSVFVVERDAETVVDAAKSGTQVRLVLDGQLVPNTPSRTIWVVFNGTTYPNESIIINTHTDGVNTVEENGHIALLVKAKDLIAHPPQRTTILLFVTGHLRIPAFINVPGQATTRWLMDNPGYWKGGPGQLTAVVGSCVEHMGAKLYHEDLATNTYDLTEQLNPEWIYASTTELNALTRQYWHGAMPNVTRVIDPNTAGFQAGEGGPLYMVDIPNISLITTTTYLLAEYPVGFDQRELVDVGAVQRQVDSFMEIWRLMDTLPRGGFGVIPAQGGG